MDFKNYIKENNDILDVLIESTDIISTYQQVIKKNNKLINTIQTNIDKKQKLVKSGKSLVSIVNGDEFDDRYSIKQAIQYGKDRIQDIKNQNTSMQMYIDTIKKNKDKDMLKILLSK